MSGRPTFQARAPLAVAVVLAVVLLAGTLGFAGTLWALLGPPLTQRAALPPGARTTAAGIPVPEAAHWCRLQDPSDPGVERWCLPTGVSARTVARWYDEALPPREHAGPLVWCVEQYRTDGSRLRLWSSGTGLVGYQLPPVPPHIHTGDVNEAMAVQVVVLPRTACPPAARASRERA